MTNWKTPGSRDEWRVDVALDEEQQGDSLSERLHNLQLDNEARKRLGGSVIVTRTDASSSSTPGTRRAPGRPSA